MFSQRRESPWGPGCQPRMKIWSPLSKSWLHWWPHRSQHRAMLKEDHEVIPILRSLLTDTLCNPPGQERLQPHHRDLRLLLFSSGVGSFTSQKKQISQSAARQTYAFSSLFEKTRRSIKSLQMSLQRQHFLPSYLKILSVGPAWVWTHDLLLSRPALSQLSQQDGNTSAAQAIVKLCANRCNNSQHCWPSNVGICCVSLHKARSLTSCKLCTTTPNNVQQHATGRANGVVGQQCCVCLHGAMVITNRLVLTSSATLPNLGEPDLL